MRTIENVLVLFFHVPPGVSKLTATVTIKKKKAVF